MQGCESDTAWDRQIRRAHSTDLCCDCWSRQGALCCGGDELTGLQVLDQLLNKLDEVGLGQEEDSIEPINTSDADGMTVLN